jgi:recombination protein RecA
MQEREQQRQRKIRDALLQLGNRPLRAVAPLPTGLPVLDRVLGGGLPRGTLTEIYGPSGCGKTTLALQLAGNLQRAGFAPAWIDADRTFDSARATSLGVNMDHMPVVEPGSAEQAAEIACQLLLCGALDLIVVDSFAALAPELELETGMETVAPSLHGRVLASALRKLAFAARRSGASLLFLNQLRMRLETGGAPLPISAGGPALKLHATVRIAVALPEGGRARFRVMKNHAGGAFARGELLWRDGAIVAECP